MAEDLLFRSYQQMFNKRAVIPSGNELLPRGRPIIPTGSSLLPTGRNLLGNGRDMGVGHFTEEETKNLIKEASVMKDAEMKEKEHKSGQGKAARMADVIKPAAAFDGKHDASPEKE